VESSGLSLAKCYTGAVGLQIVTAAIAAAALLLGLINAGIRLKDWYEDRRVRSTPLTLRFLKAWTDARHYLVSLSIANQTSVDRHVAHCWFDVWAPGSSRWRRRISKAWHRLVKRPTMPTKRGTVEAGATQIDPLLRELLAQFPDPLTVPFVVRASQAITGTLAFARFPWDGDSFEVVTPQFFYTRGVTRALAAKLVLVDDRGYKSDVSILVPWLAASATVAQS
jgi:hypothetical protein